MFTDPASAKQLNYIRVLADRKQWGDREDLKDVAETIEKLWNGEEIGKPEATIAISVLTQLPDVAEVGR